MEAQEDAPTTTPMSATLKMAKWTKVVSNMSVTKPSGARSMRLPGVHQEALGTGNISGTSVSTVEAAAGAPTAYR